MVALLKQSSPSKPTKALGVWQHAIEGRYRRISPHQLCLAWWLHTAGHLTRRQLRVYFAGHEMAERREYTKIDPEDRRKGRRTPLYGVEEVSKLVGGQSSPNALKALTADLRRLKSLGLMVMEPHAIRFAQSAEQIAVDDLDSFWTMFEQIPNRRRSIPVPRRTVRALAAGFSRGVTGMILATMIRSLFWHRDANGGSGGYRCDGRTKGSWVAEVFGLSRRAVTDARQRLIELGWIKPLDTPQWALNRWGAHDEIDPACRFLDPSLEAKKAPGFASPTSEKPTGFASPSHNNSSSLSGNLKTRRPAPQRAGPAGVSKSGFSQKRQAATVPIFRGGPRLSNVQPEDLRDTGSLFVLHEQAVQAGRISGSEAGRLAFFALAERASAHGNRPGGLFTWLLKHKRFEFITQADEDAAALRLREHYNGPTRKDRRAGEGDYPIRKQRKPIVLTEDEQVVRACLIASKKSGHPPFRLAQQWKQWTPDRWETAQMSYKRKDRQRWETIDDEAA